jgi:hypothetical protein
MNSTDVVMFSVVAVPMVLAIVANFVLGGCKYGSLEKRIELGLTRDNYAVFFERLKQRLAELGFRQGNKPNEYLQGSKEKPPGDVSQCTHANTLKIVTISVHEESSDKYRAALTLAYLSPIIGDTGECSYRDAVLNYVTGQANSIDIVPNRSFMAFSTFVGGICAWVVLFVLHAKHFQEIRQVMAVLCLPYLATGVLAIVGIARKPKEVTGLLFAVTGIIATLAALAATFMI